MTGSSTALGLQVFGGPHLRGRAGSIGLSPYQAALLALVYGHENGGLSRRRVAWFMWEADDDARVRQRIRQLLLSLRRRAGTRLIDGAGDQLHASPHATSDLVRFRADLAGRRLRDAAESVAAGFLSGLTEAPCDAYEDWIAAKGLALRQDLRDAAARSWDLSRANRDWSQAFDAAEAMYLLDPTDEATVQRVIEARAVIAGRSSAEAAYATLVESLDGREPASETKELMARVRSLGLDSTDRTDGDRPYEAPLVGRQDALAMARDALERAGQGAFEFVVISGEAGIGKTRVLEEVRRDARLAGFRCYSACPVELERRIPLNPLLDALNVPEVMDHIRHLDEPWRAVLSALFPAAAPGQPAQPLPQIREGGLSRRLLDAFLRLFETLASDGHTALFIDDLQWADATTLAVLQFVQRRWRGGPLAVVAAMRSELLGPDDELGYVLSDPSHVGATRIELPALASEAGIRLVRELGGEDIDASVAARICDLGGGTPFYLVELAKDYMAKRLQLPAVPVEAIAVPVSLQQLYDARVARLSGGAARCVAVLAVWSRPMKLPALAEVTGMALDTCADCAEELTSRRLARVDHDTMVMAHELLRSAAYRSLSGPRKALLHNALADYLHAHEDEANPGELAIHYSKAGKAGPAARYGRLAATAAQESGALAEAIYFYRLVVDNEADSSRKAEATADLATAIHLKRDLAKAGAMLEIASDRLRRTGNHDRALRIDVRRIRALTERAELPVATLIERLVDIRGQAHELRDWEAIALTLDAELHLHLRTVDRSAIQAVFRAMRECSKRGSPVAECICAMGLAMNVAFGDPDEGLQAATTALQIAEVQPSARQYLVVAYSRLVTVLTCRGMLHMPAYAAVVGDALHAAESSGDLASRVTLEENLASFHMDAGEFDLAELGLQRAYELAGSADLGLVRVHHHIDAAELSLHRHDYVEAERSFEHAQGLLHGMPHDPDLPSHLWNVVRAGLGLCALQMGRLSEARRYAEQLEDDPPDWHFDPSLIIWFRAWLLYRSGRLAEAMACLRERARGLRQRYPTAWLKLCLLEGSLPHRGRESNIADRMREARALAHTLCLMARVKQFDELLV